MVPEKVPQNVCEALLRGLSFSGLKGPNSGPPRVVVSVDDSRGSLWFRRRFRRTSGRLCCGGPLFELFGAERSKFRRFPPRVKFRTPAGRSICEYLWMSPGVHFGSGEGSAERLRGFVAGVRFLSFSGLKGPNSLPPRVVVSVDESRGSLWFRRRFRRTSGRLCCGGPLFELFGAERSKFRTPAGRSICG